MHRFLPMLLFLLILGFLSSPVSVQALEAAKLEERIFLLEKLEGPRDEAVQIELNLYREAVASLKSAKAYAEKTALFKQAEVDTPAELKRLHAEIKGLVSQPTEETASLLGGLPDTVLEARVREESAAIVSLGGRLAELVQSISTLQARPESNRQMLSLANTRLEEVDETLRKTPPADKTQEATEAMLVTARAVRKALLAEIEMLNNERLSHDLRLQLLQAKRQLLEKRLVMAKRNEQEGRDEINRRQASEAKTAEAEAAQARQEAVGKHILITAAAEMNSELSRLLTELSRTNEEETAQLKLTRAQYQRIDRNYQRSLQQLEITRLDQQLGQFLRTQQTKLPKVSEYEKKRSLKQRELDESRLAQFRLQESLNDLQDIEQVVATLLASEKEETETLSPSQLEQLTGELHRLMEDRKALLTKLDVAYTLKIKLLGESIQEQQNLIDRVDKYDQLLDENLLWIANAEPVDLQWIGSFGKPMLVLFSPANWYSVLQTLVKAAIQSAPFTLIVLLLSAALLLLGRRRLKKRLGDIAAKVGLVKQDRFSYTLVVLVITLLLAMPWPVLMAYAGWLLGHVRADAFVEAAGFGFRRSAFILAAFLFLQTLYVPNGLAEIHFRWKARTRRCVSGNLTWLIPIMVWVAFLVAMTESSSAGLYRDTIGRLVFSVAMLALLLFIWRVVRLKERSVERRTTSLVWRSRYIWYPLLLLIPFALIMLAAQGYHYTSLRLAGLIFSSLIVFLIALLIYFLAVRWLLVAQRRLALARALAKRQADIDSRASREAVEQTGEITPEAIEIPEIGLATINDQTRRLLRLTLTVFVGLILWTYWSAITPALGVLDSVTIWEHMTTEEAGGQLLPITLADIGLAALVLLLTFVAERNLPGLLEIALLQPLHVEQGNRYAVSALIRYLILAVGIVMSINLVGVGWGEVQWLIAAIGVGLGFGLKEIFANFMSGIIVLFERPVRVGDTVTLGDVSGVVKRIRMRATTITDFDNKELIIPNQNLIVEPLVNWTLSDQITRVTFMVGIAYGSDTELAHRIMLKTVTEHSLVLDEPKPTVFFTGFGDSSLDFQVAVHVKERIQRRLLTHDLHMALEKALRENDVEIPYPQRDLHLRSVDENIQSLGNGKEN
ncbi:MAG: hypothetical protein DIZ78_15550 [endosymbiont of Escarpia spicata]|uniref:Mechanosensitive ion channel protein MscS n=1 Tax=endosymbiont of Escarpia spicata TaxID=2200908 RepID=A0A370DCH0_9GAMM|nr:MAG: hypothetical protein DIZ78_15550 [endosymbiont of Escarpia spicata]